MAPARLKRFRRELRVRAVLVLVPFLQRLPIGLATALGAAIGWLGYFASARQRRLALAHLAIAFPEKPARARRSIARASFTHLGRTAAESMLADKLPVVEEVLLDPRDEALLREAHARGRGVVVMTGHLGNWELFARRIAALGMPCGTVAKEAQDPRLTALLEESRRRAGLRLFWRGAPNAARELIRFLHEGALLGVLIDQDTRVAGHFVDFFGRPAFTPRTASDLAIRNDTAVLFGCAERIAPRQHRVIVSTIDFAQTGDREADALALTRAATQKIEAQIRAKPEQWVWMHPRWKTQAP